LITLLLKSWHSENGGISTLVNNQEPFRRVDETGNILGFAAKRAIVDSRIKVTDHFLGPAPTMNSHDYQPVRV
jgi:hypothetical protein